LVNEYPFQAAVKAILAWRGVPIHPYVRAPLRTLEGREAIDLRERLGALDERYVFEAESDLRQ
jgi:dihydrodipicolinate synthase/N-acetylneuraminate lyase